MGRSTKAIESNFLPSPAITSERQPIRPAQSKGASATSLPTSPSGNAKRASAIVAVA
jgi:hypothetical protein